MPAYPAPAVVSRCSDGRGGIGRTSGDRPLQPVPRKESAVRHANPIRLGALALSALPWIAAPALAQEPAAGATLSQEEIAACLEDGQREGCATVLIRVLVCAQASEIAGCAAINEQAEAALAEIEADVEVGAEGERAEPVDEDEPDADDAAEVDAADEDAIDADATDADATDED
jgi:hypothetical protein